MLGPAKVPGELEVMSRHVILFLAANPYTTDHLRLSEECAAIERELRLSTHRDDFQFVSRWAVSIDELLRHLNELNPTVIHFSGHGSGEDGLLLQDEHGQPQPVSARALAMIIDAAAQGAQLVVLNACCTTVQAEAMRAKVDCVVGMAGAIGDHAARAFATRFYGALGHRRSIGNAVDQAVAALAAKQLPDEAVPRCMTRDGVDGYGAFLRPRSDAVEPRHSSHAPVLAVVAQSPPLGTHTFVGRERELTENQPVQGGAAASKHVVLFLAANPSDAGRLALDRDAHAIHLELQRSGCRDRFEVVTRWAAEPLDLLRELRQQTPTIVHFSGHSAGPSATPESAQTRDVAGVWLAGAEPSGVMFDSAAGRGTAVTPAAFARALAAAGTRVRLVVMSACFTEQMAAILLPHVDCVVGMTGAVDDAAARSFAVGFYGGLGEHASIAAAFERGKAAIDLAGLPDADRPRLEVRDGVDATQIILAAVAPPAVESPRLVSLPRRRRQQRWVAMGAALVACAGLGAYIVRTARTPPERPRFDATGGIVVAGPDEALRTALCSELDRARRKLEPTARCLAIDEESAARREAAPANASLLVFVSPARPARVTPLSAAARGSFFQDVPAFDLSGKDAVTRAAPALHTLAQVVGPAPREALVRCAPASTGPLDTIDLLALVMEQFSPSCKDLRSHVGLDRRALADLCPTGAMGSWNCRAAQLLLSEHGPDGWRDLAQLDRAAADPHIAAVGELERAKQACDAGDAPHVAEIIEALVPRFRDPCGPLAAVGAAACALFVASTSGVLEEAHRAALQRIVGIPDRAAPSCEPELRAAAFAARAYWALRGERWREAADDYDRAYRANPAPEHQLGHVEALLHQRDDPDRARAAQRTLAELGERTDPVLRVQVRLLAWILQRDVPRAEQLRNAFAALGDGAVVYTDASDPSLRSLACPSRTGGCVYDVLSAPSSTAAVGRLEQALGLTSPGASR
jgi:hypothetical protein